MNDPNGLVYLDGEYHLFYQHNPTATGWGPMYWGHAVSTDLTNWQDLPIALEPDEQGLGFIWSGSVVADINNTAGFQTAGSTITPLVPMYTQEKGGIQVQSLAYSNDRGRTWTKYSGNPVINMPSGLTDMDDGEKVDYVFRDPKVFWHAGTSKWIMVISAGDRVYFYNSTNLKNWNLFGSVREHARCAWHWR